MKSTFASFFSFVKDLNDKSCIFYAFYLCLVFGKKSIEIDARKL